jgi:hypothetical protein
MNKKIFCMKTTIKTTLNNNDKYDVECTTKILPVKGQSFAVNDTFEDQALEQETLQKIITESQQDALSILREYPEIFSEHTVAGSPDKNVHPVQSRSISYRIGLIPENIDSF